MEVNFAAATAVLGRILDPYVATAVAALLAHCARNHDLKLSGLRTWFEHAVPEVAAIAAMVLTRYKPVSSASVELLERYSSRTDRLPGSHAVLRYFFTMEHLHRLARTAPDFVWEIFTHDRRLGGMGQRHIPMRHPGRQFQFLTRHLSWKARETGTAIYCADDSAKCDSKLGFLEDTEPRVRFRALEGILLSSHAQDLQKIVGCLLSNDSVQRESRSWRVRDLGGEPRVVSVSIDDERSSPTHSTGGFGHGNDWDVAESIDDTSLTLRGFATIALHENNNDYDGNKKRYEARREQARPLWAHAYE